MKRWGLGAQGNLETALVVWVLSCWACFGRMLVGEARKAREVRKARKAKEVV